jgi:hypothetical protein
VITWKPRHGWLNYIETVLKEIECVGVDWIHVGQWQTVFYGKKLWLPKKMECGVDKLRDYYLWKNHFVALY